MNFVGFMKMRNKVVEVHHRYFCWLTEIQTNKFNRSNKNQYANIFDFIEAFYFANICRDRGNPTYGFFLNPKHYNLTYLSQKLFFNVKMVKKYRNTQCQ